MKTERNQVLYLRDRVFMLMAAGWGEDAIGARLDDAWGTLGRVAMYLPGGIYGEQPARSGSGEVVAWAPGK